MPQTVYAVYGEKDGVRYCLGVYNVEAEAHNRTSFAKEFENCEVKPYELGTDVEEAL